VSAEAERIVAGVQQWLIEAASGEHGGLDTGAPTCGVCPVCRAVGAVRSADPAVLAAGLEVATSAALVIADALKRAADELMDLVTGSEEHHAPDGDSDGDAAASEGKDDNHADDNEAGDNQAGQR